MNPEAYAQRNGKLYRKVSSFSVGTFKTPEDALRAASARRDKLRRKTAKPAALLAHEAAIADKAKFQRLVDAGLPEEEIMGDYGLASPDTVLADDELKRIEAEYAALEPTLDALIHEHVPGAYVVYVEMPGHKLVECKACKHRSIRPVGADGQPLAPTEPTGAEVLS